MPKGAAGDGQTEVSDEAAAVVAVGAAGRANPLGPGPLGAKSYPDPVEDHRGAELGRRTVHGAALQLRTSWGRVRVQERVW